MPLPKVIASNSSDEPPFDFLIMNGTNPDGSPRTEAVVGDFPPPLSLEDPGVPSVAPPDMYSRLYVFEDHPGIPHDVVDGCRAYLEQVRRTINLAGRLHEEAIPPEARERMLQAFRAWNRR